MFDTVITLKSEPVITHDDYGNEVKTTTDREVFAQQRGVYESEFYNASQVGLHPSKNFRISNTEDYQGEKVLEHEGKLYTVVRVDWDGNRDTVNLVCEERAGFNEETPPDEPETPPDEPETPPDEPETPPDEPEITHIVWKDHSVGEKLGENYIYFGKSFCNEYLYLQDSGGNDG